MQLWAAVNKTVHAESPFKNKNDSCRWIPLPPGDCCVQTVAMHLTWCICGNALTCDCKTGFLAQDCTILVLSEALIEPFIWFVSSSALHFRYVQGAVGEQVHPLVLHHAYAVLEPSDVDGRLAVRLTVQDNGVPPHDRDIARLLDEK